MLVRPVGNRASSSGAVERDQGQIVVKCGRAIGETYTLAQDRATGTVKELTERAPTTRKVRMASENMTIWSVAKKTG